MEVLDANTPAPDGAAITGAAEEALANSDPATTLEPSGALPITDHGGEVTHAAEPLENVLGRLMTREAVAVGHLLVVDGVLEKLTELSVFTGEEVTEIERVRERLAGHHNDLVARLAYRNRLMERIKA